MNLPAGVPIIRIEDSVSLGDDDEDPVLLILNVTPPRQVSGYLGIEGATAMTLQWPGRPIVRLIPF